MHSKKTNNKNIINIRNGTPRPTPEITTPAVSSPVVTVELEPDVGGGGRENTKSNGYVVLKTVLQDYECSSRYY